MQKVYTFNLQVIAAALSACRYDWVKEYTGKMRGKRGV